jgi:uncharacterized membrane protein YdfJ with MMPL/SSD domain
MKRYLVASILQNYVAGNGETEIDDDANVSSLVSDVMSATIVFLYTYPTLLTQLIPLLCYLMKYGKVRSLVTLTYHLPTHADLEVYRVDNVNNLQWYRLRIKQE